MTKYATSEIFIKHLHNIKMAIISDLLKTHTHIRVMQKADIPTTVRNNSLLQFPVEKQKVSHGLFFPRRRRKVT